MPDSPPPPSPDHPPRVTVTLPPGGGQVVGRIHCWRPGADGTWHAEVTIQVPAVAVQQIPGEDYRQVPKEPAAEPEAAAPQFVLDNALPPGPNGPRLLLHDATAGCWVLDSRKKGTRITPVTAEQARQELGRGGITTRCDACNPQP